MMVAGRGRWLIPVLVVALVAAPTLAQGLLPPSLADAVDEAIVLVNVVYDSGGRPVRGSGSGIVIGSSGLILTAEHVINRATSVEVQYQSGVTYPARVVGRDPVYDAALLRIEPQKVLPTASLGAASTLHPGDLVTAFGRSPRRRAGPSPGTFIELDLEARPGTPYLRSTAVVFPGDSGGALVNDRGEVVGLIVAITRNGQISLAVSTDAVRSIMDELRAGLVRHPWLGIFGTTITPELARDLALPVTSGVLILDVAEGGPAALAGVRGGRATSPREIPRGGDVITALDGKAMPTFGTLASYILGKRIGDTVALEVWRDGLTYTIPVVLGERPTT